MLPTELPVEIWLLILRSLSTRDLVFLSLTCKLLNENERMRRQDIDRLLSKVVNNVYRFRHLMRTTGSLIIGDFAVGLQPANGKHSSFEVMKNRVGSIC
jgi:hypothetical protein